MKIAEGLLVALVSFGVFYMGSWAEHRRVETRLQTRCITAVIKNVPNLSGEQLPLVRAQCEIAVRDTLN
jgi:hypothetical protein